MARFGRKDAPATGPGGRGPAGKPARGEPARGKAAAGKAGPGKAAKTPLRARVGQVRQAFVLTKASDPRLVPILLVAFLVPFLVLLGVGFLISHPVYLGVLGFLAGLLAVVVVFGRRLQKSAYSQVEGQVGAAASVLTNMRGDWRVTPAVGFTREQDLVHRVVGRPGIVLVAEGSPRRIRGLLVTEKKRVARVVGDTPVYDVQVGDGEGMIALRDLERHFVRLPRNIKPAQVNIIDGRLKALGTAGLPVPKGPLPNSGRMPRGKVR